jgi:hypothetical protein
LTASFDKPGHTPVAIIVLISATPIIIGQADIGQAIDRPGDIVHMMP